MMATKSSGGWKNYATRCVNEWLTQAAGDEPYAVAVNPVTNQVYVPNQNSDAGQVSVVQVRRPCAGRTITPKRACAYFRWCSKVAMQSIQAPHYLVVAVNFTGSTAPARQAIVGEASHSPTLKRTVFPT